MYIFAPPAFVVASPTPLVSLRKRLPFFVVVEHRYTQQPKPKNNTLVVSPAGWLYFLDQLALTCGTGIHV